MHKRVCKKLSTAKNSKSSRKKPAKKVTLIEEVESEESDDTESVSDLEVEETDWLEDEMNASLEDYNDNLEDDIEEVQVGLTVSVSTGGIFESILNLKEWMKQPWSLVDEL